VANFEYSLFGSHLSDFHRAIISFAMNKRLSKKAGAELDRLYAEGNKLVDKGQYAEAVAKFAAALDCLPRPCEEWDASTQILGCMGDAYFLAGEFAKAAKTLDHAMQCPDAIGNTFLHLRLGQSYFEVGNKKRAVDELTFAYEEGGLEMFDDDDPKYFNWLKTQIKPPASGKW